MIVQETFPLFFIKSFTLLLVVGVWKKTKNKNDERERQIEDGREMEKRTNRIGERQGTEQIKCERVEKTTHKMRVRKREIERRVETIRVYVYTTMSAIAIIYNIVIIKFSAYFTPPTVGRDTSHLIRFAGFAVLCFFLFSFFDRNYSH